MEEGWVFTAFVGFLFFISIFRPLLGRFLGRFCLLGLYRPLVAVLSLSTCCLYALRCYLVPSFLFFFFFFLSPPFLGVMPGIMFPS